jgi:polyisoprenoid-binding protein YceI
MMLRLFLTALLAVPAVFANDYTIDTAHSSVSFSVRHMMITNVKGEFQKLTGKVFYDEKNPAATRIEGQVETATINTREPKRDAHLRSPDFFDVEKYPTITFTSKKAWKQSDVLKVSGDLTLHGVTKEVVFDVKEITPEIKDPGGNFRRGASAAAKINRKDFGMTWNRAMDAGGVVVGDEVTITIDAEVLRRAATK